MIIYLIRHGETDWNCRSKIQGQADIPLNKTGRKQAKLAAARMAGTPIDFAYTSPLRRAMETAGIFLTGRKNCPLHTSSLLKEISYGVREGQPLQLIHHCPFLRLYNFFKHPERYIPPREGETIQQLKVRSQLFLKEVTCNCKPDSSIMVFTHGAFIKATVSIVKQLPNSAFWSGSEVQNCSATILEFRNGRFGVLNICSNSIPFRQ
ncbi:MAG: histidine phosphatase family protein [Oscillospiraceae bacterium]|jgi:probable phosphoglycerate mutase|nr:histidine phosphatase family protein [Oscillospiraceae bacterium]